MSKKESIKTARFDGLIDLVENHGEIGFLIKKGDELVFLPKIEKSGVTYIPPSREQIPFLLPRLEQIKKSYISDNDQKLFYDLVQYHKKISELPDERYYYLLPLLDMHTYILEQVTYSPIICFDGMYERGKTRTGTGILRVAYRGILAETLREPHIFRYTEYFGGTMFFDVRDFATKVKKYGSEDIFLKRFEKGAKVPRVKDFKKKPFDDTVYYSVFGPTIIATNESLDKIHESRGITINMRESDKEFCEITPETGLSLKERLVAFRARRYGKTLPPIEKVFKGRFADIVKPLFQIAYDVDPSIVPKIKDLLNDIKAGKDCEKAQSREAYMLRSAWECKEFVRRGLLPIEKIVSNLEKHKIPMGNKTVANKFRQMGFETERTPENKSALVWDEVYLTKQMQSHFVKLRPHSPYSPYLAPHPNAENLEKLEKPN